MAEQRDEFMKGKYKETYNKKVIDEKYDVGQLVWVYTPGTAQKLKAGRKLTTHWSGPYEIVKICSRVNVKFKRCNDNCP